MSKLMEVVGWSFAWAHHTAICLLAAVYCMLCYRHRLAESPYWRFVSPGGSIPSKAVFEAEPPATELWFFVTAALVQTAAFDWTFMHMNLDSVENSMNTHGSGTCFPQFSTNMVVPVFLCC